MRRYFFWQIILFFLFMNHSIAQEVKPCSIYEMEKEAEREDPGLKSRREALEEFTRQYINSQVRDENIMIIPVVFHVVHNYGAENISRSQILDAVKILNEDYRKKNNDTSIIIPEFKPIASDTRIEFRLAKLDPEGNCTEGITRTASSLSYVAGNNVKELARWPRNRYLNIWVVGDIASGAAGYAYYPGIDQDKDGIVVRHDYTGSIGTSNLNRSRTLTHEVGHYLNLMHPWGNSNEPGLADNCNIDDEVEDTPLTIGNSTCNLSHVSCGSLDNVQNYMEYSYCTRMFTEGQKLRMRAALNSTISERIFLWQNANLIATGTNYGYQSLPCDPVADFSADQTFGCDGISVQFYDQSYNSEVFNWDWVFEGGSPSVSTEQNPVVVYSQPGNYPVSLTVSNQAGADSLTRTNYMTIRPAVPFHPVPYVESFENPLFPVSQFEGDYGWFISGDGLETWERTDSVGNTGSSSCILRNNDNSRGATSIMISPGIDISLDYHSLSLRFRYAYAQRSDKSEDELAVWVSNNCGTSWQLRYIKDGYFLSTNGGVYVEENFIPSTEEWKWIERDILSISENSSQVMIKIQAISNRGNNLYIDDVEIAGNLDINVNEKIVFDPLVYPNPVNSTTAIYIPDPLPGPIRIELTDMFGRILLFRNYEIQETLNKIEIGSALSGLPGGIYFLKISGQTGAAIRKIGVTRH
jgi:PKD repeat protein